MVRFLPVLLASSEVRAELNVGEGGTGGPGGAPPVTEAIAVANPGDGAVAADRSIAHSRTLLRIERK